LVGESFLIDQSRAQPQPLREYFNIKSPVLTSKRRIDLSMLTDPMYFAQGLNLMQGMLWVLPVMD